MNISIYTNKMLSYRRDTALQGALVSAKSGKLELENHNRPAKMSNSVKKREIRAISQFKVIQGHRGRCKSKARMRLPISD